MTIELPGKRNLSDTKDNPASGFPFDLRVEAIREKISSKVREELGPYYDPAIEAQVLFELDPSIVTATLEVEKRKERVPDKTDEFLAGKQWFVPLQRQHRRKIRRKEYDPQYSSANWGRKNKDGDWVEPPMRWVVFYAYDVAGKDHLGEDLPLRPSSKLFTTKEKAQAYINKLLKKGRSDPKKWRVRENPPKNATLPGLEGVGEDEAFQLLSTIWDVSKARKIIEKEPREPVSIPIESLKGWMGWESKEEVAEQEKRIKNGEMVPIRMGFVYVNREYANKMSKEEAQKPGIATIVYDEKEKQYKSYLIDGWHRAWASANYGFSTFPAYRLTPRENHKIMEIRGKRKGKYRGNPAPLVALALAEKASETPAGKRMMDKGMEKVETMTQKTLDNPVPKKEMEQALAGEGWAINDYTAMLEKATPEQQTLIRHIIKEEKEHQRELLEIMGCRENPPRGLDALHKIREELGVKKVEDAPASYSVKDESGKKVEFGTYVRPEWVAGVPEKKTVDTPAPAIQEIPHEELDLQNKYDVTLPLQRIRDVEGVIKDKDLQEAKKWFAPANKDSRNIFRQITGIKLPGGERATEMALEAWLGVGSMIKKNESLIQAYTDKGIGRKESLAVIDPAKSGNWFGNKNVEGFDKKEEQKFLGVTIKNMMLDKTHVMAYANNSDNRTQLFGLMSTFNIEGELSGMNGTSVEISFKNKSESFRSYYEAECIATILNAVSDKKPVKILTKDSIYPVLIIGESRFGLVAPVVNDVDESQTVELTMAQWADFFGKWYGARWLVETLSWSVKEEEAPKESGLREITFVDTTGKAHHTTTMPAPVAPVQAPPVATPPLESQPAFDQDSKKCICGGSGYVPGAHGADEPCPFHADTVKAVSKPRKVKPSKITRDELRKEIESIKADIVKECKKQLKKGYDEADMQNTLNTLREKIRKKALKNLHARATEKVVGGMK